MCGYLRPEKNFDSLESLISAIKVDIQQAEEQLEQPNFIKLKTSDFFTLENNNGVSH